MGQKCPENCKNCIKIVENARFSCKMPKIWRYFCAFLLLDKCQFDRPTMVDYAGISIKSTVRINKFQIAVLCNLHKNSRKPNLIHATPYAPYPIAGRTQSKRPVFPPTRPYAKFLVTTRPAGPICSLPETNYAGRLLDKKNFLWYNFKKNLF